MLGRFYLPRWQLWIDWLTEVATHGGDADPGSFRDAVVSFEDSWADQVTIGQTEPSGDVLAIAAEVLGRSRDPVS